MVYFGARFYDPNQPRFMSADWADKPEAVPYSDLADPQSLNLYSYVRNNPVSRTDADGHCCEVSISDIIQFGVGVIQGAVSAFSQGGVAAAQPSSEDTGAQRLGQAVGANGVGLYGAGQMVDGGAAVGAAVTACGGSGGAACGVAAPLGAVGAAQVAAGGDMAVGALKTDIAIVTTPLQSKSKPDARPSKAEKNTVAGAQEQADSIAHAQDKLRKSGQGEKISSTTKSRQRLKNAVKQIKSSKDLEDNGH
jgi:RHS repeat-associated protein